MPSVEPALGGFNSFHYAEAHKSPENQAYVRRLRQGLPEDAQLHVGRRLMTACTHPEVLKKTGGDAGGDKFIEAAKG